jgi:hypothetical protein
MIPPDSIFGDRFQSDFDRFLNRLETRGRFDPLRFWFVFLDFP